MVQEFLIPLRPGNDKEGGGCPEHLLGADLQVLVISNREVVALLVNPEKPKMLLKMMPIWDVGTHSFGPLLLHFSPAKVLKVSRISAHSVHHLRLCNERVERIANSTLSSVRAPFFRTLALQINAYDKMSDLGYN